VVIKEWNILNKNQSGSFTLEASLVFPVIMILLIVLIYTSIFTYQRVLLYYVASDLAETVAFTWDNSNKDNIGAFSIGEYDELYWRLTDDQILELVLGRTANYHAAEVPILSGINSQEQNTQQTDEMSLPELKLSKALQNVPKGLSGTIRYQNNLIEKKIIVRLYSPLKIPLFVGKLLGEEIVVEAEAVITDPVEFIRTVDLIRRVATIVDKELIDGDFFKSKKKKVK